MHGKGYITVGDVRYWYGPNGEPPVIPNKPQWDDLRQVKIQAEAVDFAARPALLVKAVNHWPGVIYVGGEPYYRRRVDGQTGQGFYVAEDVPVPELEELAA